MYGVLFHLEMCILLPVLGQKQQIQRIWNIWGLQCLPLHQSGRHLVWDSEPMVCSSILNFTWIGTLCQLCGALSCLVFSHIRSKVWIALRDCGQLFSTNSRCSFFIASAIVIPVDVVMLSLHGILGLYLCGVPGIVPLVVAGPVHGTSAFFRD